MAPLRIGTFAVGRKTPLDGKLEIDAGAAEILGEAIGRTSRPEGSAGSRVTSNDADDLARERPRLRFVLNAVADAVRAPLHGEAVLVSMSCTCAKAPAGTAHTHHFLQAAIFKRLVPQTALTIDMEENGELHIGPAAGA